MNDEKLSWKYLQGVIEDLEKLELNDPQNEEMIKKAKLHLHLAYIHADPEARSEYEMTARYLIEEK